LSPKGIIRKVIVQNRELSRLVKSWVGKSWKSCVTTESELKIDQLLRFSNKSLKNDRRHVNHHLSDGGYLPVSYATLNCEREGFVVAVGRELSQLTALQQKLVSAQQTLERDYVQLRHVETRYRSLFNLVETPVLVCKAVSTEILEINPAAIRLLNCDTNAVIGKNWTSFSVGTRKRKLITFLDKLSWGRGKYLKLSL
jgi:PAS domain-containing protein